MAGCNMLVRPTQYGEHGGHATGRRPCGLSKAKGSGGMVIVWKDLGVGGRAGQLN